MADLTSKLAGISSPRVGTAARASSPAASSEHARRPSTTIAPMNPNRSTPLENPVD